MRKQVFLFIAIIVGLAGCSGSTNGLVEYENTKLNDALKGLSFKPEIPKILPYSPSNIKVDAESISGEKQTFYLLPL